MLLTRRQLPLNALRAFETVAKHCHMRRAAEDLGVTHAAVSRHVKLLEELLNVTLLERAHNRLELTAAGERLYRSIESAFNQVSVAALYLDPDAMQGSLVLATTPSISVNWLLRVMGEFSLEYPEIDLQLINIQPGQKNIPVEAEIAICYDIPNEPQRQAFELYREYRIPICSPILLRDDKPVTKPIDLFNYPLIHDRHASWSRWFKENAPLITKADNANLKGLTVHDTFQAIPLVVDGFGIGLFDRNEVIHELHNGSLIALMDAGMLAKESVYLMVQKQEQQTLRAKLFQTYLITTFTKRGINLDFKDTMTPKTE